jgi:hypothetical protein
MNTPRHQEFCQSDPSNKKFPALLKVNAPLVLILVFGILVYMLRSQPCSAVPAFLFGILNALCLAPAPPIWLFWSGAASFALARRQPFITEVPLVIFSITLIAAGFIISYPG